MKTPHTHLTPLESIAANLGVKMADHGLSLEDNPYISAAARDLAEAWERGFRWHGLLKLPLSVRA